MGLNELIFLVAIPYGLALLALYWVIRLGVRHGTLDAYKIDRTDQRFARLQGERKRQEGSAGTPE